MSYSIFIDPLQCYRTNPSIMMTECLTISAFKIWYEGRMWYGGGGVYGITGIFKIPFNHKSYFKNLNVTDPIVIIC